VTFLGRVGWASLFFWVVCFLYFGVTCVGFQSFFVDGRALISCGEFTVLSVVCVFFIFVLIVAGIG